MLNRYGFFQFVFSYLLFKWHTKQTLRDKADKALRGLVRHEKYLDYFIGSLY